MSEKILRALMQLFAIIAKGAEQPDTRRLVVADFLQKYLNADQVDNYLQVYDSFFNELEFGTTDTQRRKKTAVSSVKVIVICNQLNEELSPRQKVFVLLYLLDFLHSQELMNEQELEFVNTVASSFNISEGQFQEMLDFADPNTDPALKANANLLSITSHKAATDLAGKRLIAESLPHPVFVLRISSAALFLIRFMGDAGLTINGQRLAKNKVTVFAPGSSVRGNTIQPIFYSDVARCFMSHRADEAVSFEVKDIQYRFKSGKLGLQTLRFTERSGHLMGIMGGSGAGKSTLLNILNGNNPPTAGKVLINGIDLHKEKAQLEGLIGFVPQDDLLIEELTVFENLYFNSRLCFNQLTEKEIADKVLQLLNDIGLYEARDLKVGNPLEKTISGGQRKRLNIALELIREPSVLFLDEPTSGLSSRDSENIMDLLKELSLRGKLVFVVIHQPSSEIFKMFDKLLILDVGGYPVYLGDPVESVIYFKRAAAYVDAEESECLTCGNVNPEQVFSILEARILDENGNPSGERKVLPKEWNERYQRLLANGKSEAVEKTKPVINFHKPGLWKQFTIFLQRDFFSKLANTQYLLINILEPPLLAFILAFLCRFSLEGQAYTLGDNRNIPAYMFMCVVVSLFIGLTVSAEEIFRDRKILRRESFLNLSKGSYLFSKIVLLFGLSAFQMLIFVWIGNTLLGIQHMHTAYWLVLFTSSCFANMLGLNISASFNSAVTIYILIPFLLIPQLLLSGVIVKFDELNPIISSRAVVPLPGELMTSRWAFEALAVNQFTRNDYEQPLYTLDRAVSLASLKKSWCMTLLNLLDEVEHSGPNVNSNWEVLCNELKAKQSQNNVAALPSLAHSDKATWDALRIYLEAVKGQGGDEYNQAIEARDRFFVEVDKQPGGTDAMNELKKKHHNGKLEDMARNPSFDAPTYQIENERLVTTIDPIFRDGVAESGFRAHFLAPRKYLLGSYLNTFEANLVVIWISTILLGFALYFDVFKRLLTGLEIQFGRLLGMKRKKQIK